MDSTNLESCSVLIFTTEKNPHINGLGQFKSVLFKVQLCNYVSVCVYKVMYIGDEQTEKTSLPEHLREVGHRQISASNIGEKCRQYRSHQL